MTDNQTKIKECLRVIEYSVNEHNEKAIKGLQEFVDDVLAENRLFKEALKDVRTETSLHETHASFRITTIRNIALKALITTE